MPAPSPTLSGQPAWHDLFTPDIESAKVFYSKLLGWHYQTEHATDFVWYDGEADYPLIMVSQQAHGGMVQTRENQHPQWLTFVDVDDVDQITKNADDMGAEIVRAPFEIPGVGYCSVIADPQGALISPFKSSHTVPPPRNLFVWDQLISQDVAASSAFYCVLFDWPVLAKSSDNLGDHTIFHTTNDRPIAGVFRTPKDLAPLSQWIPFFGVPNVEHASNHAKSLGANFIMSSSDIDDIGHFVIFSDPAGALFGVVTVSDSSN